MAMAGRSWSASDYRYGYQGSEINQETHNNSNRYTTEFRQLDARFGRWFSIDPVFQPWQSPYNSMDGNPVCFTDVRGLSTGKSGEAIEHATGEYYTIGDDYEGYTVAKGDNLMRIAERSGVSVESLRKANGMSESETHIQPGDILNISGAREEDAKIAAEANGIKKEKESASVKKPNNEKELVFEFIGKGKVVMTGRTEEEMKNEVESRGYNWDSDWYDNQASGELWQIGQGSDGWGHSTGTFIVKYLTHNSYKDGAGKPHFKEWDRNLKEWLYAKDASMEGPDGMVNGLKFGAQFAGLVLSGGTIGAINNGAKLFFTVSSAAFAVDDMTSIGNDETDDTILEALAEHIGGDNAVSLLKSAKIVLNVKNGLKSAYDLTVSLKNGDTISATYDAANGVLSFINTEYNITPTPSK